MTGPRCGISSDGTRVHSRNMQTPAVILIWPPKGRNLPFIDNGGALHRTVKIYTSSDPSSVSSWTSSATDLSGGSKSFVCKCYSEASNPGSFSQCTRNTKLRRIRRAEPVTIEHGTIKIIPPHLQKVDKSSTGYADQDFPVDSPLVPNCQYEVDMPLLEGSLLCSGFTIRGRR